MYKLEMTHSSSDCISRAEVNLMKEIRVLWEQHSAWTRNTIVSIVLKLPDEKFVVNRLLRNPHDFAIALTPFYGAEIACRFELLLTEHLTMAAELIKAVMAGDDKLAEDINRRWYENADEISAFLNFINQYWNEEEWRIMFYKHLGFVMQLASNMINGDYAASILTYDQLEVEALEMADMMSEGIIKQFPCRFNIHRCR